MKKRKQSEKEIEAVYEQFCSDNRERLRSARDLAKEAFKTSTPTFEEADTIAGMLKSGVDHDLIVSLVMDAVEKAAKFGAKAEDAAADVFDIFLEDENGMEHLLEAEMEAKSLFGASCPFRTVLDVYYRIYSTQEEGN